MSNHWNDRYAEKEFAYGTEPNLFFKEQLDLLPAAKIILPCEGEGRNAVYAAKKGWDVTAFDLSHEGRKKAMQLAGSNAVRINYSISNVADAEYPRGTFDVAALIYTHLPVSLRGAFHRKVIDWLKPGGMLILEAFNPLQLGNSSGGPKDISMLYTEEILKEDFKGMRIQLLVSEKVTLDEGKYHQGPADVIRFIGLKEK